MARVPITIPDLGESLLRVRILRWLKKAGDTVAADEAVVEITTDKIDVMLPSPARGILEEITTDEGEDVAVGKTIGVIATLPSH